VARTRAEAFADLVVAAVLRLRPRWGPVLEVLDVAVLEVPEAPAAPSDAVPLAGHHPAGRGAPAVLVVYRHPVTLRAPDRAEQVDLVRDLVAEELAELIGTDPESLDPGYGRT
jgi:hypothetical protein